MRENILLYVLIAAFITQATAVLCDGDFKQVVVKLAVKPHRTMNRDDWRNQLTVPKTRKRAEIAEMALFEAIAIAAVNPLRQHPFTLTFDVIKCQRKQALGLLCGGGQPATDHSRKRQHKAANKQPELRGFN